MKEKPGTTDYCSWRVRFGDPDPATHPPGQPEDTTAYSRGTEIAGTRYQPLPDIFLAKDSTVEFVVSAGGPDASCRVTTNLYLRPEPGAIGFPGPIGTSEPRTPEEVARDYGVPVEAVHSGIFQAQEIRKITRAPVQSLQAPGVSP